MPNKELLIYAYYYAPDVASTSQTLQDIAEGMTEDFDVTVICTVPSYIESRIKNYLAYFAGAQKATKVVGRQRLQEK